MQFISLNNSSLSQFTAKGNLTQLAGSSCYNVFDYQIVKKEKRVINKIESKSAITDYLNVLVTSQSPANLILNISISYCVLWTKRLNKIKLTDSETERLNLFSDLLINYMRYGENYILKTKLIYNNIVESKCRYKERIVLKSDNYRMNKTKVKSKIYALFNLKDSRKFVAFYSVSFPAGNSDNSIFECWNYWLTLLRKEFGLLNYIWITERQKNGTLHFHMFTNQFLPIQQINRGLAIIINNKVLNNEMIWNNSNIDKFNGVDVDSIYSSKRHKKTGKTLNPVQVRQWLSSYVTKYVTKNTDTFKHLCWHCSRSVSQLFTSQLYELNSSYSVVNQLPYIDLVNNKLLLYSDNHYIVFNSQFNSTYIFKFNPPPELYKFIIEYNDLISAEFEPQYFKTNKLINFKTTNL